MSRPDVNCSRDTRQESHPDVNCSRDTRQENHPDVNCSRDTRQVNLSVSWLKACTGWLAVHSFQSLQLYMDS